MKGCGRRVLSLAIIGGLAVAATAAPAQDQEIYDAIDCSQWTLNPDGTWDTGPRADIPGARRRLSNLRRLDLAGFYINGTELSAWLKAKCVNKCQRLFGVMEVCS